MDAMKKSPVRHLFFDEKEMIHKPYKINEKTHYLAIDEVGVGALAGEIVVAGVVLPDDIGEHIPELPVDSKLLSDQQVAKLSAKIKKHALMTVLVFVTPSGVDKKGVEKAKYQGWRTISNYVREMYPRMHIKVDGGMAIRGVQNHDCVVGGDGKDASISAASIIAKKWLNERMFQMDQKYKFYGFGQHKGYNTTKHVHALKEHGVCPYHRKNAERVAKRKVKKEEISLDKATLIDYLETCANIIEQTDNVANTWEKNFVEEQLDLIQRNIMPTPKSQYYIKKTYIELHQKVKKQNITIIKKEKESVIYTTEEVKQMFVSMMPIFKKNKEIIDEWETNFLKTITKRVQEGKTLTAKQSYYMKRCYEKMMAC